MSAEAMQQAGNGMLTIGIDLGDKRSAYCVLGKDGEAMEEGARASTPLSFERPFLKYPRSLVALEVCFHSRWASLVLERCGDDVLVANACKVRLITQATRKMTGSMPARWRDWHVRIGVCCIPFDIAAKKHRWYWP